MPDAADGSPTNARAHWADGPATRAVAVFILAACVFGAAWSAGRGREGGAGAGGATGGAGADVRLDLNTAEADALAALPGIGPVMAARIVAHRASIGRFGALEELDGVPGIGPARVAALRPHLKVTPARDGAGAE